jgi:hypothetical protein
MGLGNQGIGVQFPAGVRDVSLIQSGSRAHPASIQWVPGALSPAVKRQGSEVVHHLHLVSRSWTADLYLHSPMCLHGTVLNYIIMHRDNFTFTTYDFDTQ